MESKSNNTNLIFVLVILVIGFFIFIKQQNKLVDDKLVDNKLVDDNNINNDNNETDEMDEYFLPGNGEYDRHDMSRHTKSRRNKSKHSKSRHHKKDRHTRYSRNNGANIHKMFSKISKSKEDRESMKKIFNRKNNKNIVLNTELIEDQYHKDYNDTITAINNLTPQKELFNMGFLPVKILEPNPHNVKELVKLFVRKINDEVKNRVSEYLNPNSGWNDQGKRKKVKSGFEEQMEELGLPGDLYTQPADKAEISLVAITNAEQHMTDDQIRFIIHIVVQKKNVKDQMALKLLFFMEKEDLKTGGDHRASFFDRSLVNQDRETDLENLNNIVVIEQIFTEGFLTNSGTAVTRMDNFHEYKGITGKDGIIDQYKVLQIMKKKHEERSKELSSFLCSVDDDTKEIHDVPSIGDYQSYKNTRTIMDDLAINPQRSFGRVTV